MLAAGTFATYPVRVPVRAGDLLGVHAEETSRPYINKKVGKGRHSFQVRAVDAAGNADPSEPTDEWKVKRKRK